MKIEIGESLMYSWLRHVKGCQIAQLNWKSAQSVLNPSEELNALFITLRENFMINKEITLPQFLKQAEIDVLGIALQEGKPELYAVDIAFHENGLGYRDNINIVAKKLIRSALILNTQFGVKTGHIVFASPYVRPSVSTFLRERIKEVENSFKINNFSFTFHLLINDDFKDKVLNNVLDCSSRIADTSDLFVRAAKMISLFHATHVNSTVNIDGNPLLNPEQPDELLKSPDEVSSLEIQLSQLSYRQIIEQIDPGNLPAGLGAKRFFTRLEKDSRLAEVARKGYKLKKFPLLLTVHNGEDIQTKLRINGRLRYYAQPFINNGQNFLLCNDWSQSYASILKKIADDLELE